MKSPTDIPKEVIDAIRADRIIEAIKAYRTHTGAGLKESKDAVDRLRHNDTWHQDPSVDANHHDLHLPGPAVAALRQGRLVDAIKETRKRSGGGLKDTKELVESYLEQNPRIQDQFLQKASENRKRTLTKLMTSVALFLVIVASYRYLTGG